MKSIPQDLSVDNQTRQELQAAAEARITELYRLADKLVQETEGVDHLTVESLRAEGTRLYSIAFEITSALAHGDIEGAYHLSLGDYVGGTALEVAV